MPLKRRPLRTSRVACGDLPCLLYAFCKGGITLRLRPERNGAGEKSHNNLIGRPHELKGLSVPDNNIPVLADVN